MLKLVSAVVDISAFIADSLPSSANALEEIIVTSSYHNEKDLPNSHLKHLDDHMLLTVNVVNDTREEAARKNEIYETLKNAIKNATKQSGMELSVFDPQSNLLTLTRDNYQIQLNKGTRPDTNTASIRLKMKIPESTTDSDRIIVDMLKFMKTIKVSNRTILEPSNSIEITIIDPNQYHPQIIERFSQDVAMVMKALSPDYHLLADSIDRPMKFSHVNPMEITLYIPYNYHIVPTSISSIKN